jgi:hypothetical protein
MVNNSTNINKIKNHILPQIIELKKRSLHMARNPMSWLGQAQNYGGAKPPMGSPSPPLPTIRSPTPIQI